VRSERRENLAALTERRERDRHDVEAIEEVIAKPA
jgi:hypothetical protein